MTTVPVSKWMKAVTNVVNVNDPIWKAWRIMKESDIKVLPVMSNKRVVGLVTAKDIVRSSEHNGGQSMSVKEARSLDPLIVQQDQSLVEAVHFMLLKDQQYAIVVDAKNQVVGVFAWSEAFQFFLEKNQIQFPIQRRFK